MVNGNIIDVTRKASCGEVPIHRITNSILSLLDNGYTPDMLFIELSPESGYGMWAADWLLADGVF